MYLQNHNLVGLMVLSLGYYEITMACSSSGTTVPVVIMNAKEKGPCRHSTMATGDMSIGYIGRLGCRIPPYTIKQLKISLFAQSWVSL